MEQTSGSPRVEGDEEEEDIDDLENEFDIGSNIRHGHVEATLSAHHNTGHVSQMNAPGITTPSEFDASSVAADIPLLTYDHEVN